MKTYYLISEHTKEHIRWTPDMPMSAPGYKTVEADSEGWIAWDCEADLECPISEDQPYHARLRSGSIVDGVVRWDCYNNHGDVLAYRPILTEKVQEPEPQTIGDLIRRDHPYKDRKQAEKVQEPDYDPRSVSFNLLDRLKAAHEHAQTIPDLEAELREVLAGMGYDLVARSPFVNQCCGNPAQCWEPCGDLGKSEAHVAVSPEPDMTDWRNWREGDVLTCVRPFTGYLSEGENYVVSEDVTGDYVGIILQGDSTISSFRPDRFRFHSRPAKGEK